ncbi:PAS-domain containing protein [Sedimenticola selenatireducens]|uniref:histidine kinase n=1 Tax=Sedimenticola selenatireducens TaxID=191960 RepID=A0A558DZG3_9GAMM|nr:PAS-domain containing protein [Sedimenticola selenatireducens]TVO71898.1 PAS domain S-box protein [Sedimenticola selenatireducens]TVT66278.1 MAG: PAS domain S-box protein [Sedimenticola selenatireducens]
MDNAIPEDEQDDVTYLVNVARDAFGHLVQGLSVCDENLDLVFFNDRFRALLDFPTELVHVGTNVAELFRYNAKRGEYGEGDIEQQVSERVALAKQFTPHSFQRERPDGTVIQIDGSPMSSGGFVTTYTDITEKVRYEAFLKSIIEASPAGFGISRHSDGKISFLNTRLAEMYGMPVREMIGFSARNLYANQEDRDKILKEVQAHKKVSNSEIMFKRKNGDEFAALISLYPTTYQNEPSFFSWIYDISNLKEAQSIQAELERELNQAQKLEAIGQLAGGIAHEINTPSQYVWDNLKFLHEAQRDLRDLLGDCLSLVERVNPDSALKSACDQIREKSESIDLDYLLSEVPAAINQSITGISDISRIVLAMKEFSHPGEGSKSIIDINHMLENTLTISRSQWKDVATVNTAFDPTLPHVSCQPGEMNQVFLNLLVNASHAIEEAKPHDGGKITIKTTQREDKIQIQISDNGAGIPGDLQDKIFEPFFTTKEVGKGTGQGLSIARNIVTKKHGGEIYFTSEPNKGTLFTIELPIHEIKEPA